MTSRYHIIVAILYFNLFSSLIHAQSESGNRHVMERLIQIKYNTELMLIGAKSPHEKDSVLVLYNQLRWHLDGLIYAISMDMIANNNIKAFKILQSLSLFQYPHKRWRKYFWVEKQWNTLNQLYNSVITNQQYEKNINLTTNVFYIIKDSWSFLEGIQKIKSDKIKNMVDLLDQTRIRPPLELLKNIN